MNSKQRRKQIRELKRLGTYQPRAYFTFGDDSKKYKIEQIKDISFKLDVKDLL